MKLFYICIVEGKEKVLPVQDRQPHIQIVAVLMAVEIVFIEAIHLLQDLVAAALLIFV